MTSRVENILAGSQLMDLNPGELNDLAYRLFERAGMGEGTLQKIRNVILMSFDGCDMQTFELPAELADSEYVRIRIVDSIPPDGDDDEPQTAANDIIRPR